MLTSLKTKILARLATWREKEPAAPERQYTHIAPIFLSGLDSVLVPGNVMAIGRRRQIYLWLCMN
jgi:hypothetical protein